MRNYFVRLGGFTSIITLICVFVFVFLQLFGVQTTFDYFGYPTHLDHLNFEYWRLITPSFIHFSVFHLVGNLCWWLYLGKQIEEKQGRWILVILTLLSGLFSNFMEYYFSQTSYFGGLSGVVFAVIGYVWIFGQLTKRKQFSLNRLFLPNELFILSLIWLIVGYFGLFGNVANMAHLSGLIFGFGFAIVNVFCLNVKTKQKT